MFSKVNRNSHFISRAQFGNPQKIRKEQVSYANDKSVVRMKPAANKEDDMASMFFPLETFI